MAAVAYPSGRSTRVRSAPERRPTTERTYRRRRLVAVVLCALLPGGFAGLLHAGRAGAEVVRSTLGSPLAAPERARTHHVYVVQPGDTLWDVARATHPHGDLRPVVDRLARAHGRGPLLPGERLQW